MPDDNFAQALAQRISFSAAQPFLQLAWDSTSLGELKTCPRKYELGILLGYAPHSENVHLRFGTVLHEVLEFYDRQRATGAEHESAVLAAVRRTLELTWNKALGRPWTSDDPNKNRATLLRSIIWYLDQFANDPCETVILASGKPAVELSFRFEIGLRSKLTGEEFLLCGHLDKLAHFNGRTWILDRKTTKATIGDDYFAKYSPDNQMSLYSYAGHLMLKDAPVAGVIIDAAQVAVTFTRFQRYPIGRTEAQLDEWLRDTAYWLSIAETFVAQNYWPQNDRACNLFGGCQFRPVCSASPELRPAILASLYSRRAWDPLVTREV